MEEESVNVTQDPEAQFEDPANPSQGIQEEVAVELPLTERQQRCREFAEATGYALTVGANVRKYGGPPPDGSERPRNSEIFLGRLPPTIFEDELVPILEQYGPLWEVRVLLDEKAEFGRGFAFATFYTPEIARNVTRTLTNKPIPGHPDKNFSISLSKPHSLVMIKNLPKHKTRKAIMNDFEGFFEGILGVNIWGVEAKPPVLMASLEFGSERAAAGALGQILAGEVQPYNYKLEAYYSTCEHNDNAHIVVLHIRNLPENATEESLQEFFSHYPAFERARIINKFAFVHFRDHVSAERALQEQYGNLFMGRPLEMAWARTKTFVPTPPPPLPVSKKSEERLYAYASGGRHGGPGPQRHGGPPQRSHPYRDGPPRDRRRPGPPSHGPYRGASPGRFDSPPPPFYNAQQANYRPQSYNGPPSSGNGYNYQQNYPAADNRVGARPPGNDQRYGPGPGFNNQAPQPPIGRGYDQPHPPVPVNNYGYDQGPPQSAAGYQYQYSQPNPSSQRYGPPQPQAPEMNIGFTQAYNRPLPAPTGQTFGQADRITNILVPPDHFANGSRLPAGQAKSGTRPTFIAQQNGWEG